MGPIKLIQKTGEKIGIVVTAPARRTETMLARMIRRFMTNHFMKQLVLALEYVLTFIPRKWEQLLDHFETSENENVVKISTEFLRRLSMEAPVSGGYCVICLLLHLLHLTFLRGISSFLALQVGFSWKSPFSYMRLVTHIFCHNNIPHLRANLTNILLLAPFAEIEQGSIELFHMVCAVALSTGISFLLVGRSPQKGASGIVVALLLINTYQVYVHIGDTTQKRFFGSHTDLKKNKIPIGLVVCVSLWLLEELWNLFYGEDGFSHLIGGAIGALVAYGIRMRKEEGNRNKSKNDVTKKEPPKKGKNETRNEETPEADPLKKKTT